MVWPETLTGLEVETEEHLGYPKHAAEGRNGADSRNGSCSKQVITEVGTVEVDVPSDGSFESKTVRSPTSPTWFSTISPTRPGPHRAQEPLCR